MKKIYEPVEIVVYPIKDDSIRCSGGQGDDEGTWTPFY